MGHNGNAGVQCNYSVQGLIQGGGGGGELIG